MKKASILAVLLVAFTTAGLAQTWHDSNQDVTLNPSDEESGVENTFYCIVDDGNCDPRDDSTYTTGGKYDGSPFTVSQEGVIHVFYNTKDRVGNIEDTESRTVRIDKTAPVTSPEDYTGEWRNDTFTVNLQCNERPTGENSGCNTTKYCVYDGTTGSCTPSDHGSSQVTFSNEGKYTLRYMSSDNAGNVEPTKSTVVRLDFTNPEILVNKQGSSESGRMNATVSCEDDRSGCNPGTLKLYSSETAAFECPDDRSEYNETSPFEVEQHLWICAAGKDDAGNWGSTSQPVEFSVGTLTAILQYPSKPDLIYTSVGSRIPITVELRNDEDMSRTINVSTEGVPVTFGNDKSFKEVEFEGVADRRLSAVVEVETPGNQTLTVNIQDETEGFTITRTANIFAQEGRFRTAEGGQVPGPGLIQIAAMFLLAIGYFAVRKR